MIYVIHIVNTTLCLERTMQTLLRLLQNFEIHLIRYSNRHNAISLEFIYFGLLDDPASWANLLEKQFN